MTLITVYRYQPRTKGDANGIICLSDSLITDIKDPIQSYTDHSIKVMNLDIGYYFNSESYPKLVQNEIGLAYAGNTSIALQTYNTVRIFCKNLVPKKQTKYFTPSIESIAHMAKKILNDYCQSYNWRKLGIADTDFLIFGFCFKEKQFKLFNVSAKNVGNNTITTVNNIDLETIKQYSIGTGAVEFNKFYEKCSEKNLLNCFKNFIKTDLAKEKAVGGYITKSFAGIGYFRYYAENNDNNCDLSQISNYKIGGSQFIPYISDDYNVAFAIHGLIFQMLKINQQLCASL